MTHVTLEPVVRSVDVGVEPAEAFLRFTEEMTAWWPLGTHSVGAGNAASVRVEPREGGGIIESTRSGEEHCWGTITWWDPPRRLGFTWHPGRDPATAQEIEVTFEPRDGGTRVILVHGGWSRFGPGASETHAGYGPGWEMVLGLYADA